MNVNVGRCINNVFTQRERYQRYERYQRALRTSQTRTPHDIAHHRETRGRRRRRRRRRARRGRPRLRHAPAARRRSRHRARFTHRAQPSRWRCTRDHRAFDSPVVTISTTLECIPTSTTLSDPLFIISYFEQFRNEKKKNELKSKYEK